MYMECEVMDNLSRTVKLKIREVLYKMTIITFYTIEVILKSTIDLLKSGLNVKDFNWWVTDKGRGMDKVVNESIFWAVGKKSEAWKWVESSK